MNTFHANSHFKHIVEFINQAFVKNDAWGRGWGRGGGGGGHECVSHTGLVLRLNTIQQYSVRRPRSPAMCRAEVNRLPLTKIQFSAIKYFEHILSSQNTSSCGHDY